MSEQLPSVDDLLESKLPSVDEFIKEEDLPSVDEFIGEEPPRPEEEIADNYASRHQSTPDHEKGAEEVVTMHEKMYRIATAKYNPFAIGGSESLGGGSEQPQKKHFDWEETAPSEYEPPDDRPLLDPHDDPFGGY